MRRVEVLCAALRWTFGHVFEMVRTDGASLLLEFGVL